MKRVALWTVLCLWLAGGEATLPLEAAPTSADQIKVGDVPAAERERLKLAPCYVQYARAVEGIPVVASARVRPEAIAEAVWLIDRMLAKRPDVWPWIYRVEDLPLTTTFYGKASTNDSIPTTSIPGANVARTSPGQTTVRASSRRSAMAICIDRLTCGRSEYLNS